MGEVRRAAPAQHAAKEGGGGSAGHGGRSAARGGRGGAAEYEYSPLVLQGVEPGAAAEAEAGAAEAAVEVVAAGAAGQVAAGMDGDGACRPCAKTWRDGSWAVRAPQAEADS